MERQERCDRGIAILRWDAEEGELPTPGHAPAYFDPDKNLIVEALIARDGLLRYTDNEGSWLEYRPREELIKAAASFAGAPVTDQHPPKMVTPETWARVAKGVHVGAPRVVELDGVTYLQATLRYTDAKMITKVVKARDAGKRVELSIGFTCMSVQRAGLFHGRAYVSVQTQMRGNHTATLKENEGRAGASCRLLFDGAACPIGVPHMADKNNKKKTDAEGNPVDMVPVTGPDGSEVEVPTWVAAELEALAGLRGGAPTPPAPAAPPMPAPDAAGAPVTPPQPAAQAVLPDAGGAPPPPRPPVAAPPMAAEEPEDKADSIADQIRVRRQLERAAEAAGATEEVLDSSDNDALRRFVVGVKSKLDSKALARVGGDALIALFDSACAQPAEAPPKQPKPVATPTTPWPNAVPKGKNDSKTPDPALASIAQGMRNQGY